MVAQSVVAIVDRRHRDRDHLALLERQLAFAVHDAVVKGHQGATTNGQFLVRIDTATGAATPIGDSGFDVSGLAACARRPEIFSDGFESDDTSAW